MVQRGDRTLTLVVRADLINLLIMILQGANDGNDDGSLANLSITFVVQFVFISELTLRIVASGYRFWKSWWNVFDFVVSPHHPCFFFQIGTLKKCPGGSAQP